MKTILAFLYFLLLLILLFLIIGIFLPKSIHMQETTSFSINPEIVFDQVNTLSKWELWSPWFAGDSTLQLKYNTIASGNEASCQWKSNISGSGKMIIVKSVANRFVRVKIDFNESLSGYSVWQMDRKDTDTRVYSSFEVNNLSYFERYFLFLYSSKIRKFIKQGLIGLARICDEARLSRVSDIEIVAFPSKYAMILTDSAKTDDLGTKRSQMFKKLETYLNKRNLSAKGQYFILLKKKDPENYTVFSCGIPIEKRTWGWKEFSCIELGGTDAAMIKHWGIYSSQKPYKALDKYFDENKIKRKGLPIEEYLTDATIEKDTTKWRKNIYYLIQK